MHRNRSSRYVLTALVVLLVVALSSLSWADNKKNAPPPQQAPHQAPSNARQAPGAPQQSHPGPGGGTNGMNRGPGGGANGMNRGPGGNNPGMNNNRPGNQGGNQGNHGNQNQMGNHGNQNQMGGHGNQNQVGGHGNQNQVGGHGNQNQVGGHGNQNQVGGHGNQNQVGGHGNQNQVGGHGNQAGNHMGNQANPRHQPAGAHTVALKNGGNATFRKDGHVRSIQTRNGTRIEHGMHGQRRVIAEHNGRHVVAMGHHGGYSQRAYYRNGNRVYVQRTYVVGGVTYAYAYRSYYYGGYPYYGYAPAYYYGPAYYGWAYNPWPAPVYYNWGWAGQPWYGYYGPYYQPYPAYPYASYWLTDYLISENLRLAYAAAAEQQGELTPPELKPEASDEVASLWSSDPLVDASIAAAYESGVYLFGAPTPTAKSNSPQLTPEIKNAISDEIKNEIAAEKDAAGNKDKNSDGGEQVPAALDPKTRYFVVSSNLDLTTSDGNECELTQGDVIYRTGDTPDDDKMVDAVVKASKKDECAVGATVAVEVNDLQEMHNSLLQTMDGGLKKLAENSGKNGLPTAPDTKTTSGEVPAPAPDNNVSDDLQATQKEADQAEAEAQQPN